MAFRTLEIYAESCNGGYRTRRLSEVVKDTKTSQGYYAFYTDLSVLDAGKTKIGETSLLDNFQPYLKQHGVLDIPSVGENKALQPRNLYLVGKASPADFAKLIPSFLRSVRELCATVGSPITSEPAYALHQASVYDLVGDRHAQSANISNTLGYREYFLWDDGGLWTQEEWANAVKELTTANSQNRKGNAERDTELNAPKFNDSIAAEHHLAWLGSGAISLQLRHLCESDTQNPWPYPPALAQILDAAIARLERFDLAVMNYYRETESREPPGYRNSDYVRLLCNFLPDHRSRLHPKKFLSSNSQGDFGGPRPWQGVSDWRMEMKLMHLLLDGLLTLWPKDPDKESSEGTELMLQPGSLAILYWAARTADMPWTKTPTEFLKNYQWDDPNWFGGRRQRWLGNEWQASS